METRLKLGERRRANPPERSARVEPVLKGVTTLLTPEAYCEYRR